MYEGDFVKSVWADEESAKAECARFPDRDYFAKEYEVQGTSSADSRSQLLLAVAEAAFAYADGDERIGGGDYERLMDAIDKARAPDGKVTQPADQAD